MGDCSSEWGEGASDIFFDLALFVVGVSREPARRTAEAAIDLVSGLFVATEREVGIANRATEFNQSHVREIGGPREELERPLKPARAEPTRGSRSAIPGRERATPRKLWPKANAQLSLLVGRGEGLEPDGGLPTGSRKQRATELDQQPLAIGHRGDQRETRLRVEDQ